MTQGLRQRLADEDTLWVAFDRLRARPGWWRRFGDDVFVDPDKLVRTIARRVKREGAPFSHARTRDVDVEGKSRRLFSFTLEDTVLHFAAAAVLLPLVDAALPETVWSYRPKRSADGAVHAFGAYARMARARTGGGKGTGLCVLRRDVESYGDVIPLGADSRLWTLMDEVAAPVLRSDVDRTLLRALLAPDADDGGGVKSRSHGAPTGSPLHTVLTSVYLLPLDRAFADRDVFYARFGDDILVASADAARTRDAATLLDDTIQSLHLRVHPKKAAALFVNGAGTPRDVPPPFVGTRHVAWLGWCIDVHGRVSAPAAKVRALLAKLRARAHATAQVAKHLSDDERTRLVCAAIAAGVGAPPLAVAQAQIANGAADDRGALRDMDHRIALVAAEALSGVRGVRAFAHYPPRRLRRLGLPSLVVLRNRGRRARTHGAAP